MTDIIAQQTDGSTGDTGTDQDQTGKVTIGDKTFTQEQFDSMIDTRLARQKRELEKVHADKIGADYADYDTLKAAAAKLKALEDADKTDLQKLTDRLGILETERVAETKQFSEQLATLQEQNIALEQQRTDLLLRTTVVAEATRQGFYDPDDAYGLLDLSRLTVKDGKVDGIKEVLQELAKAKPYLLQEKPRLGPTYPGRSTQATGETDAERRTRLYGAGSSPIGTAGGGVFRPKLTE